MLHFYLNFNGISGSESIICIDIFAENVRNVTLTNFYDQQGSVQHNYWAFQRARLISMVNLVQLLFSYIKLNVKFIMYLLVIKYIQLNCISIIVSHN